ncbi:uncharacterized protein [Branchiostoma lanceolatum]|uniref:uncharacterized protein n=1 Tax=Branchiostoma lanceolatum TaxID=7740 RepID=UPI0034569F66
MESDSSGDSEDRNESRETVNLNRQWQDVYAEPRASTSGYGREAKRMRTVSESEQEPLEGPVLDESVAMLSSDEEEEVSQEDDSEPLFKIREIRQRPVKKFNTNQVTMTAIPNREVDLAEHDTIMHFLNGMFEGMINHVDKELKHDDKIRLVMNSERLDKPVSTKLVNKTDMSPELILSEVERVMQSHKDFLIDDTFFVDLLTVQFPEKGSGYWRFFCNIEEFVQKKQCIIQIKNRDELCCGRALVVARTYLQKDDPNVRWNSIRLGRKIQTVLAQELYQDAGVAEGPCGLREIQTFQDHLSGYQIVVISAKELNEIVFKGPEREQKLILYLINGHYNVITSIEAFTERAYFCWSCNKGYNDRKYHRCENVCKLCKTPGCLPCDQWVFCADCNRNFRSQRCYDNHKIVGGQARGGRSVCDNMVRCNTCLKVHGRDTRHQCFTRTCRHCREDVDINHLCYMQKIKRKKERADKDLNEVIGKEHERREVINTNDPNVIEDHHQNGRLQRIQLDNGEDVSAIVIETEDDFQKHFGSRTKKSRQKKADEDKRGNGTGGEPVEEIDGTEIDGDANDDDDDDEYVDEPNVIYTFDFESEQTTGEHKIIAGVVKCELDNGVIVFRGNQSRDLFCRWLFHESHKDSTFVAHNLRSYDGHFIVQYLIDNAVLPDIIYSGAKIMTMQIPRLNIKFIDSLNFLQMPLAKFPKTFGFNDISKGYFPHLFSSMENLNYRGPIPDLKYYDADAMAPDKRSQCMTFHAEKVSEGYVFDFVKDMTKYCVTDVLVLEKGLLSFRDIFARATGGINPIDKPITIASACSQVFRTLFLKANTIGIVPSGGYRHYERQSKEALDWLNFVAFRDGVHIQHVNNGGEKRVCGRKVDGFCEETKTVYEYNGCFYHGCQTCFKPSTRNPVNDTLMIELYMDTLRKKRMIERTGLVYVEMWTHEFDKIKENDPDYTDYRQRCPIVAQTPAERDGIEFLNPRDAFFGGRTNATKLYAKVTPGRGETIEYVDFTSLYPYVNKYGRYPTGHADIIVQNFKDVSAYFGVVKCKVLAPRKLYHPVLPDRVGDKLMFHLCRACATVRQQTPCHHSDDERTFVGTWASIELNLAVEHGYKILQIYEVHHFQNSSTTLFREYIDCFLRLKQESSGWPQWVLNAPDRSAAEERYLREYESHEGIKLDRANIAVNPGMRSVSKNMLNSFWGKLGQRSNFVKTEFITSPAKYFELLGSTDFIVHNVNVVNQDVIEVSYNYNDQLIPEPSNTNVYLALFTTAMARIKLYKALSQLGDAVLYYDTDSVIYKCDGQNKLPLGDYLGEFTNECEGRGEYIKEFCSGGAKNYSYLAADNSTVTKVRGFTLNFHNQKLINFPVMKDMVTDRSTDSVDIVDEHKIVRDKKTKKILSKRQVKRYRLVYDKRVIQDDFNTLPYGY